MTLSVALLALVTLQRAAELVLARRNTQRLLARGAIECAPFHYRFIVLLHAAWLGGLWLWGAGQPIEAGWAVFYIALQVARFWTIRTLGERWTTRIIVLPGAPLIRSGPFRFVDHPNYMIVAAEIAVLPLALGMAGYAAIFSFLNAILLTIRIRAENRALSELEPPLAV
jgi:methyltransferase